MALELGEHVASPAGRLAATKRLLQHVYGEWKPQWRPKPFSENKGRCAGEEGAGAAWRGDATPHPPSPALCSYLWTDAFGVVQFITLAAETGEQARAPATEGSSSSAFTTSLFPPNKRQLHTHRTLHRNLYSCSATWTRQTL